MFTISENNLLLAAKRILKGKDEAIPTAVENSDVVIDSLFQGSDKIEGLVRLTEQGIFNNNNRNSGVIRS